MGGSEPATTGGIPNHHAPYASCGVGVGSGQAVGDLHTCAGRYREVGGEVAACPAAPVQPDLSVFRRKVPRLCLKGSERGIDGAIGDENGPVIRLPPGNEGGLTPLFISSRLPGLDKLVVGDLCGLPRAPCCEGETRRSDEGRQHRGVFGPVGRPVPAGGGSPPAPKPLRLPRRSNRDRMRGRGAGPQRRSRHALADTQPGRAVGGWCRTRAHRHQLPPVRDTARHSSKVVWSHIRRSCRAAAIYVPCSNEQALLYRGIRAAPARLGRTLKNKLSLPRRPGQAANSRQPLRACGWNSSRSSEIDSGRLWAGALVITGSGIRGAIVHRAAAARASH